MRITEASYSAFAAFGLFWGTWGAALPGLRAEAGLDEGQLGIALLFVGLGALPAMLFTGRAVDRFGARTAGLLLIMLAGAGAVIALSADGLLALSLGMALVGATSGAADVASNALAGFAEQRSGRRIITTSHGVFSAFVVIGSLGAGALFYGGAAVVVVFATAGTLITIFGVMVFVLGGGPHSSPAKTPEATAGRTATRGRNRTRLALPFVVVGLVGALGFAVENAHQSWSAIFLADELGAGAGLAASAPATFAVFAALTRFAAGAFTRIQTRTLLYGGASLAVIGTILLSIAPSIPVALVGLALAAIGTSVLFPTLLSHATRDVPAHQRGTATSTVATTAYLGFVLGPVYVGLLADLTDLRGAMIGVAALAGAFALLAPPVTRHRPSVATRSHVG